LETFEVKNEVNKIAKPSTKIETFLHLAHELSHLTTLSSLLDLCPFPLMFVGGRVLFGTHRKVSIPSKMLKLRLLSKQGKLLIDLS
jgi:hypothetical protein